MTPERPPAPDVDLVIAVHSSARDIARAAASALTGTRADVRVTVVCHNVAADEIAASLGDISADPRIRLTTLADGIASPAGPFNLGLDLADGRFTSVLGSDDFLEPGAIDSWLARAEADRADAVIARLKHDSGGVVPTPPTRPGRRSGLDFVRDRLAYRSAPLGLIRRSTLGELRFAPGLTTGEDLAYVCRAWTSGAVSFDRGGPAYVIGSAATDRTTRIPRAIRDEFAYVAPILDSDWFARLSDGQQAALVVKFIRVHVFGAIANRPDPGWWTRPQRNDLLVTTRELLDRGHGIERVLSLRDRRVLALIASVDEPAEILLAAVRARRQYSSPGALVPATASRLLHREAPIRFSLASFLASRGR
ncbi:hypothetical protein GCM10010401_03580 [Rarobacter faecitabidus]|uniref:Glycosyl transferase family 2 n=1 Tax=Rarobacter faecitabidus TaxID=13243 RepID=A0A542ZUF0_RARFA|nr:glycosyltransferase family A protein [Rarobacter faecitabidus]TQL63886.1 glycosyl transferase family 2 [Rarobacter faecitabidus]